LSKKLAAGLQGLVMDVKVGNGAFANTPAMATELAQSLVAVANGAGLPTRALITDMNQVLGHTCGNAVEMQEAVDFLKGQHQDARLLQVTRQLSAELLLIGKLAADPAQALARVDAALASAKALEQFARMVTALGGPADFCERTPHYLPAAPVQLAVCAARSGWVGGMATRDIGLLVVELGGGRHKASDAVDPRVGFTQFAQVGQRVEAGEVLAVVHAADAGSAEQTRQALLPLIELVDQAPALRPVLVGQV
jgi:thymidine phosphorylase